MTNEVRDPTLTFPVIIIYAIASLYALIILLVFPNFTIDDAFITFRYAENLANYGQLTWNVGEPAVEGYTGVFLPVVLALCIKSGFSPIIAAKAIGIASFFVGGLIITLLLSRRGTRPAVTGTVLVLYFAAPFGYVHALSGLETMLFATAILASMLAMLHCLSPSSHQAFRETAFLLILLMASLIRPEGFALSALFVVTVFWVETRRGENSRRFVGLFIVLYVLPVLGYLVWKYSYYGQLLPNTFYAKAYEAHILNPDTIIDLGKFVMTYVAVPAMACIFLLLMYRHNLRREISQKMMEPLSPAASTWIASWLFVAIALLQYMRTSLVMNYSSRFFFPFFPLILMTVGLVFEAALTWATRKARRTLRAAHVIAIAVMLQLGLYVLVLQHDMAYYRMYKQIIDYLAIPAGDLLRANMPKGEWLAVHSDAGAVPYYSKLKTVDFGGLNDKVLASRPRLDERERVDYFYSVNPGAAVFTSVQWDTLDHDEEAQAIENDPRFERYALVRKFRGPGSVFRWRPYFFMKERTDQYYYFLYVRKDLLKTLPHNRLEVRPE